VRPAADQKIITVAPSVFDETVNRITKCVPLDQNRAIRTHDGRMRRLPLMYGEGIGLETSQDVPSPLHTPGDDVAFGLSRQERMRIKSSSNTIANAYGD
jgi:hypothetical protein